jgi:FixJ family two-component response regulator
MVAEGFRFSTLERSPNLRMVGPTTTPDPRQYWVMKDRRVIYLVDDDDAVRDSLAFLLESHGFDVSAFASVAEFERAYEPARKACLILDHHLPGVSGLEFLASSEGATLGIPVIVITGGADSSISARARALGVAAFLEKPITEAPLLAAIENALAA